MGEQLPLWWVFCFIATIGFGLAYWLGFQVFHGRLSPHEEYLVARAAAEEARANELAALPTVSEQMLEQLAVQSSSLTGLLVHGSHYERDARPV